MSFKGFLYPLKIHLRQPNKFRFILYSIQTPNYCRKIFNFKPLQNEFKYDLFFTLIRYDQKTYINDYTF